MPAEDLWIKPFGSFASLYADFCGVRDPRLPSERGRFIGMEPLWEYVQIKKSQLLIESGNLLGYRIKV